MTATTALTAQNTLGVDDIHNIPSSFVGKQIDACASDIGIDVVKTGTCFQPYLGLSNRSTLCPVTRVLLFTDTPKACWPKRVQSVWSPKPSKDIMCHSLWSIL